MKQQLFNIQNATRFANYVAIMVVVFSCAKADKPATSEIENKIEAPTAFVPTKLVKQADKVFELDSLTDFSRIEGGLVNIEGEDAFTFQNWEQKSIYFYDYVMGEILNIITLKQEGPNAVKISPISRDYIVHTKDSIFIYNAIFTDELYLVNRKGEVLFKAGIGRKKGEPINRSLRGKQIHFRDYTYFKNGVLHTGTRLTYPIPNQPNPIRAQYNFTTNKLEKPFLEEARIVPDYEEHLALLRQKSNVNMQKFVVGVDETLFGSSQISDSIFEFKNYEFIKAHYAANPSIKTANYKAFYERSSIKQEEKGMSKVTKSKQSPHFIGMIMDVEKKWIYRFLIHRTSAYEIAGKNMTRTKVEEASVIAFNVETKESFVIDLPKEIELFLWFRGIFANKNGIHFPVKDQETESVKSYNVYKIE